MSNHPWERFPDRPYIYDVELNDFRAVTQEDIADLLDLSLTYCRIVEFIETKTANVHKPIRDFVRKQRADRVERMKLAEKAREP